LSGSALTSLYVVRNGTFKAVTVSQDGGVKINGFYLPGDLLGLDGIGRGAYAFDSIALEDSEVCVLPLDQLESMAGKYPDLLRAFVRALSLEITREQSLTTWLGRLDAEQRVARFLLRLCERYQKLGYAKDALLLHMSRDDIGSYLALSTETVSRVISRLSRRGLLTVEQRHIGVPDFSRLTQAAAW